MKKRLDHIRESLSVNWYIVQISLWYMLFWSSLGILKKMLCTSYLKNWKLDQAAEGRRTCCPTRCCLEYQKLTLALSKFVKLTIFIFIFFIIYFAKISDKYKMQVTVYQPIFNQIFTYIYTDKFLVRCKYMLQREYVPLM